MKGLNKNDIGLPLVLAWSVLVCVYAALHEWIPKGHDGFIYASQLFYFLNGAAISKEVPQWVPYMTHGSVGTWNYDIVMGVGPSLMTEITLRGCGPAFIWAFHMGMCLEIVLMALGLWRLLSWWGLGRMGRFAGTATLVGSTIWIQQPWYNFHFYWAMPWLLYFGHRFLESAQWRFFFLMGHLAAIQTLGNLPYFIPIVLWVIVLYFGSMCLWRPQDAVRFWRGLLRTDWKAAALSCLGVTGMCGMVYFLWVAGTDQIVNYNTGRDPAGMVSLKTFLTYAGSAGLLKWFELVGRISAAEDYTLYFGLFGLVWSILGLMWGRNRMGLVVLTCVAVMYNFASGGWVAQGLNHVWPLMKYYRHLELNVVWVRFFLCLAAGLGVDALWKRTTSIDDRLRGRWILMGIAAGLVLIGVWVWRMSNDPHNTYRFIDTTVSVETPHRGVYESADQALRTGRMVWPPLQTVIPPATLSFRLKTAAVLAAVAALWCMLMWTGLRWRRALLLLSVVLQVMDVFMYYAQETRSRSVSLTPAHRDLFMYQPIPYRHRRRLKFSVPNNVRGREMMEAVTFFGVQHWMVYSFVGWDQVLHPFRTDFWLKPFDEYLRVFYAEPIRDRIVTPTQASYARRLIFPFHPIALKISGVTRDKIQVFDDAIVIENDLSAALMRLPMYRGDIPIIGVQDGDTPLTPAREVLWLLDKNVYRDVPYSVQRFDADNLWLRVVAPHPRGGWLCYSDVWHPGWRAQVNGRQVSVHRANVAYKGVQLDAGQNAVRFRFEIPFLRAVRTFIRLNAIFWIAGVLGGGLMWRVVTGRRGEGRPSSRSC